MGNPAITCCHIHSSDSLKSISFCFRLSSNSAFNKIWSYLLTANDSRNYLFELLWSSRLQEIIIQIVFVVNDGFPDLQTFCTTYGSIPWYELLSVLIWKTSKTRRSVQQILLYICNHIQKLVHQNRWYWLQQSKESLVRATFMAVELYL